MINKKFKNSRRGQVFIVAVIIAVTVALIASFFLLKYMFDKTAKDTYLGTYESGIIDALSDGDKSLLFVDQASKTASKDALLEYTSSEYTPPTDANIDAADIKPYCGRFIYKLWNNETQNCFPDQKYLDLSPLISAHMSDITRTPSDESSSDEYTKYFESIFQKSITYQYKYYPGIDGTNISAYTDNTYTVNIFRNNDVKNDESIQQYVTSKNEWNAGNGDIKGIPFIAAAAGNYREKDNRNGQIKYLVIHYTAGASLKSAVDTFLTPSRQASAHYVVGTTGDNYQIVQMVRDKDVAYHAGCNVAKYGCAKDEYKNINSESIGIEVVNIGYDCSKSDSCKKDPNSLCTSNYFIDGKDRWDGSNVCWQGYPQEQYDKLVALSAIIVKKYNIALDRDHIIGHVEVVQKGKVDPGPAFDLDKFVKDVAEAVKNMDASNLETEVAPANTQEVCPIPSSSSKTYWTISDTTITGKDLTSDQTLKISMNIVNSGDSCINIKPKIDITSSDNTMLKEQFEKISDRGINSYKSSDKVPYTAIDALTCTFTTQEGIAYSEQKKGNCVLTVPTDGRSVTYTITPKALDNENKPVEESHDPIVFIVKKGATDSYSTTGAITTVPTIQLTDIENNKIKSTKKNLEDLGIMDYISQISQKEDVPNEIVLGLITQESGGNINAVSPTGAQGLFQVIRSYHEDRVTKECGSWEKFKTDAQCQIRVGIGILKAFYDQYASKGIDFECKCEIGGVTNKGTASCADTNTKYSGWDAALRGYNSAGCAEWADYKFVNTVMRYAAGWGYTQSAEGMVKDEIQKGILGTYDIKPSFQTKLNFDLRLFNNLTDFVNTTIKTCADYAGDDKSQCVKDGVDKFNKDISKTYTDNGISMELSLDCDNGDIEKTVNNFSEDINNCASSKDDNCQCLINYPSKEMFIDNVGNVNENTVFTYQNDEGDEKNVYFDYAIYNPDNTLWKGDSANVNNVKVSPFAGHPADINNAKIYKSSGSLFIGEPPSLPICAPNKNKYRLCLNTGYTYSSYDSDNGKIYDTNFVIPFAVTIRDNVPPKPVTGLSVVNLQHSRNSEILLWDKNKETDVVKYNIYISNSKSDFDSETKSLRGSDSTKYKSISSVDKSYYEYENIDYNTPTCDIISSSGPRYCKFQYNAVDKNGNSVVIELEKEKLYYINKTKQFMYILDGNLKDNALESGTDKYIAVTAVDIDDNEINNIDSEQKIENGKNLVIANPKDLLEAGFVYMNGPQLSLDTNTVSLTWEPVPMFIDSSALDKNIKYNIYIKQDTCHDDELYSINSMEKKSSDNELMSSDIDVSKNIGNYCIGVVAVSENGIEYPQVYTKNVFIPMHPQPMDVVVK